MCATNFKESRYTVTLYLKKKGAGVVYASDIELNDQVEILNPDLKICTLDDDANLNMEIIIVRGRGYVPAQKNTKEEYPIGWPFWECREKIVAKPFHRDFDEQLDAVNALYGCYLKFPFGEKEIVKAAGNLYDEFEGLYTKEEINRVEKVLRYQAGKYKYMFS